MIGTAIGMCGKVYAVMNETFTSWIEEEIKRRGWTQAELGRRAGLAQGTISQTLSGITRPGPKFCSGIARALDIPEEEVFRRAGLLSLSVADLRDKSVREANEWILKMTPVERKQLVVLIRGIIAGRET